MKHVVPHKQLKHYRATALLGGHVFMVCSMLLHHRLRLELDNLFVFKRCFWLFVDVQLAIIFLL